MSATLLKITDAQLAAVGAKSQDEFLAKVVELVTGANTKVDDLVKSQAGFATKADITDALKPFTSSIGEITTSLATITERLGNPATLTEAKIREIATTAGSAKAAEALGATGVTPPAPPSAAAKVNDANTVQALVKAGKYAEAFAADENIRAEFGDVKTYTAFMKANRGGHIKLHNKNN